MINLNSFQNRFAHFCSVLQIPLDGGMVLGNIQFPKRQHKKIQNVFRIPIPKHLSHINGFAGGYSNVLTITTVFIG